MRREIFDSRMQSYKVDMATALLCNQEMLILRIRSRKMQLARTYFEQVYGKNQIPDFIMQKYKIPYNKEEYYD